jgi:hypothetical protein
VADDQHRDPEPLGRSTSEALPGGGPPSGASPTSNGKPARPWRRWLIGWGLLVGAIACLSLTLTVFRTTADEHRLALSKFIETVDRGDGNPSDQKTLLAKEFRDYSTYAELRIWLAIASTALTISGVAVLQLGAWFDRRRGST